jgi:RHS repeat-associated protein
MSAPGRRPRLRASATLCVLTIAQALGAQTLPPPMYSGPPVWRYEYDAVGNLVRRIQPHALPQPLVSHSQFDAWGRLSAQTDPLGGSTQIQRNAQGAITQVTDPIGVSTRYTLDPFGLPIVQASPDAGTTSRIYDAAGRVLSERDARGVHASYGYDALGRLRTLSHVGANLPARAFAWNYDETSPWHGHGIGRLTSSHAPGVSTAYAYDALGRVVAESRLLTPPGAAAPLAHTTGYAWDAADRLRTLHYPSGWQLQYAADPTGVVRALSFTGPAGTAILMHQIEWEPFGPPRSWRWGYGGQPLHTIERDVDGRVVRQRLGPWLRDIRYDSSDRLVTMQHRVASSGTASSAFDQSFGYDAAGRLTRWVLGGGISSATYDANGNRTSVVFQGGAATWLGRESGTNRLSILADPLRTAQYDAAGNLVRTAAGSVVTPYAYDAANRLESVGTVSATAQFHYDERHRRIYSSITPRLLPPPPPPPQFPQPPMTPSAAPLVEEAGDPGAQAVDLEEAPLPSPSFDTGSQEAGPSGLATTGSTAPSAGTDHQQVVFVYDTLNRLIGEYDARDGAPMREYIWLDDMPVAVALYTRSGPAGQGWTPQALTQTLFYVHSDHLNTPRVVLDQQGAMRWLWMGDPFGRSTPNTNPTGKGRFVFNLRMPGQYRDDAIGLSYNWHRFYDAGNGRYTQSDPIGLAGGINPYVYVENQPTAYIDPEGLTRRGGAPSSQGPSVVANAQANVIINQIQQFNPQFRYPSVATAPGRGGYTTADVQFLQQVLTRARQSCTCSASNTWPTSPSQMDQILGVPGVSRPDGPYTQGRGTIVWRPSSNLTIKYECHPYDTTAPIFHRGPHWHLEGPLGPNGRPLFRDTFVPTEIMPRP